MYIFSYFEGKKKGGILFLFINYFYLFHNYFPDRNGSIEFFSYNSLRGNWGTTTKGGKERERKNEREREREREVVKKVGGIELDHSVLFMGVVGGDVWVGGKDVVSVVGVESHCLKFVGKTMLFQDILKVVFF